jgi:tetratricopeptide (TPR) repeat protein
MDLLDVTSSAAHDPKKVAPTRSSAFAELLRETITDATRRLGKLKKELARDCGIRPDRLSHLQNGLRRPAHREVVGIARGLRLDERATDRLLEAAGFGPLTGQEIGQSPAAALVSRLSEPERTVAQAEAARDEAVIGQAWNHYISVRIHNQVREWDDASRLNRQGDDHYWALRALSVRFRAQLCLADATSLQYRNQLAEAEAKCVEGLVWAEDVATDRFRVMLLSRLASIKRLQSDYEQADQRYAEALAVLDAWARDDTVADADRDGRHAWRQHWRARIQRMQGLVELFKGRPVEALEKLRPSFDHFAGPRHHDELSQVLYALGWAYSLLGEFEQAKSWNQQGLDHARLHIEKEGQEDHRLLVQGHLYLGGNYLDLDDARKARVELEQALDYAKRGGLVDHYLEVGRVYRLLGKLEMREQAWDAALEHLQAALEFYSRHEERVLLATAHNAMGDFYLAQPGVAHRQRALDHYLKALDAARAGRPPNSYYECASLLNICRARVRTGVPEANDRRPGRLLSETEWHFEDLVDEVKQVGQTHHYRNHLARLAVVEAEFAVVKGDAARAQGAAATALHLANNFSPPLLEEVRKELRRLGLPHELLAVPPGIAEDLA